MSKSVWESIDELFGDSNGSNVQKSLEDDELDQNELLGIIDDEDYQLFISGENSQETEIENEIETIKPEIKNEEVLLKPLNNELKTDENDQKHEFEHQQQQQHEELHENKEEIQETHIKIELKDELIMNTDEKSTLNFEIKNESIKKIEDEDEDDDENENLSRRNHWSERREEIKMEITIKKSENENDKNHKYESKIEIKQQQINKNKQPTPPSLMNIQTTYKQPMPMPMPMLTNPNPFIQQLFNIQQPTQKALFEQFINQPSNKYQIPIIEQKPTDDSDLYEEQLRRSIIKEMTENRLNKKTLESLKKKQKDESIAKNKRKSDDNKNISEEPPIKKQEIELDTNKTPQNNVILDIDDEYKRKLEEQKRKREEVLRLKEEKRIQRIKELQNNGKIVELNTKTSEKIENIKENVQSKIDSKQISTQIKQEIQNNDKKQMNQPKKPDNKEKTEEKQIKVLKMPKKYIEPLKKAQNTPLIQQQIAQYPPALLQNPQAPPIIHTQQNQFNFANNQFYGYFNDAFMNQTTYSQQITNFYQNYRPRQPITQFVQPQQLLQKPIQNNYNFNTFNNQNVQQNLILKNIRPSSQSQPPQPIQQKSINRVIPQNLNESQITKAILTNLSLNTNEKVILDLCNNINVKAKVLKINMEMTSNKAEITFADRESAEKFFKQYNRTLIDLSIVTIKIC